MFWCVLILIVLKYADCTVVLERIYNSPNYSKFYDLLYKNNYANYTIFTDNLTMFVPSNDAFLKYKGDLTSQLLYSHISFKVRTLKSLQDNTRVYTSGGCPFLVITRNSEGIFVNNAKIITGESDFITTIKHNGIQQTQVLITLVFFVVCTVSWLFQVLHCIDEVIKPCRNLWHTPVKDMELSNLILPDIEHFSVTKTFHKILEHKLEHLYNTETFNTYFLPIDACISEFHLQNMDEQVLKGHIIPNAVLYTRPVLKNVPYETLANEDYIYILVYFLEISDRLFVKSYTLSGDIRHPLGEQYSEIIFANIPIANGVVHIITRPLVLGDEEGSLFPFLSMHFKVFGDPTLNMSYHFGEASDLNQILKNNNTQLTYFIPRDAAWMRFAYYERRLMFLNARNFYGRHLIVSDTPYSMKVLELHSRQPNNSQILLNTVGGTLAVKVRKIKERYFIYWKEKVIPVYRPDYRCTNGIVHVIDYPFISSEDLVKFSYSKLLT